MLSPELLVFVAGTRLPRGTWKARGAMHTAGGSRQRFQSVVELVV